MTISWEPVSEIITKNILNPKKVELHVDILIVISNNAWNFLILEEGRVSVEEEDDFGMVEMEPGALSRFALVDSVDDSGPADRFEDGDSEENFVNANIFVENLDDIDALTNGAFSGARLFVNTSKHFLYRACEKLQKIPVHNSF